MEMTNILGPLLVAVAFLVFGKGMVKKSKGKSFRPIPVFFLILFALSFRFLFGEGSFLDKFTMMLFDVGVGMTLDSFYLAYHKENAKLFWVPGILALILSGMVFSLNLGLRKASSWMERKGGSGGSAELLLEIGEDDSIEELQSILSKYDADFEKAYDMVDMDEDKDLAQTYLIHVAPVMVEALIDELKSDRENVDFAEKNGVVSLVKPIESTVLRGKNPGSLANDPLIDQQWFYSKLSYNDVYKAIHHKNPKKKIKLAIVDTGVDSKHEDLSPVFDTSPGDTDKHSHGTHCAGIAAGATNNGKGIASLNWGGKYIDIVGYKALSDNGSGSDKTVSEALIKAAEDGADVISMSLGGFSPRPPRSQKKAVEYALKQGAIIVVAAGNSNDDAIRYSPANIPGVIVVSAVDQNLNKAVFSNTNNNSKIKMPIAAPGVDIMSSIPGSDYKAYSGTSMATPMTAGLIGMLKSFDPDLTAKEVHKILVDTGKDVKDSPKIGKVIMPLPALEKVW